MSPPDCRHNSYPGEQLTSSGPETLAQTLSRETKTDPDLACLVEGWPALPEALRAGIVAMVNAASKGRILQHSEEVRGEFLELPIRGTAR